MAPTPSKRICWTSADLELFPESDWKRYEIVDTNEGRKREIKLRLSSLKGVKEYWILNWRLKQIEIYHRDNSQLQLQTTLLETDSRTSSLLLGFDYLVSRCF